MNETNCTKWFQFFIIMIMFVTQLEVNIVIWFFPRNSVTILLNPPVKRNNFRARKKLCLFNSPPNFHSFITWPNLACSRLELDANVVSPSGIASRP